VILWNQLILGHIDSIDLYTNTVLYRPAILFDIYPRFMLL